VFDSRPLGHMVDHPAAGPFYAVSVRVNIAACPRLYLGSVVS